MCIYFFKLYVHITCNSILRLESFFLAFLFSMLIHGERPGIFSVFSYLTNEFTYAQCNYSSKQMDHLSAYSVSSPRILGGSLAPARMPLPHSISLPSFPMTDYSQLLSHIHKNNPSRQNCFLKTLIIIFLFFLNKEISRIQLQLDRLIIPRLGKSTTRKWVCSTFHFLCILLN